MSVRLSDARWTKTPAEHLSARGLRSRRCAPAAQVVWFRLGYCTLARNLFLDDSGCVGVSLRLRFDGGRHGF